MKSKSSGVPPIKQSHHERVLPMNMIHIGSNSKTHTPKKHVIPNSKEGMTLLKDHGITTPKVEYSLNLEQE